MDKKPRFFYGWVILAISFGAMTLAMGARNSFSIFFVVILEEFGWSRAGTAGIFSLNVVVYGIAAPFSGALVDKFGPRKILIAGTIILSLAIIFCSMIRTVFHLYILFGAMAAIGTSLIGYPVHSSVLPNWFVKRRGLVFGIFTSGWGASFLLMPLVQSFIVQFGWRISFVLFGALIGAILLPLFAIFSRHRPEDIGILPDGDYSAEEEKPLTPQVQTGKAVDSAWINTNWTLRKALRTYQFWLIFFSFFCIFGIVENMIVVHQIALMKDVGLSESFAASIVALWGLMVVIGNLSGFFSDKLGREKTFTLGTLISVAGICMLLLTEKIVYRWMPYIYAVSFGLGVGINSPILGAALADIFHGKNFGSINGFVVLGFGLGGIIGPWLGGFIFDTTGSYSTALLLAIVITCIALVLLWLAAPRKIRKLT